MAQRVINGRMVGTRSSGWITDPHSFDPYAECNPSLTSEDDEACRAECTYYCENEFTSSIPAGCHTETPTGAYYGCGHGITCPIAGKCLCLCIAPDYWNANGWDSDHPDGTCAVVYSTGNWNYTTTPDCYSMDDVSGGGLGPGSGDMNQDGEVSILDLTRLIEIIMGAGPVATEFEILLGDVSGTDAGDPYCAVHPFWEEGHWSGWEGGDQIPGWAWDSCDQATTSSDCHGVNSTTGYCTALPNSPSALFTDCQACGTDLNCCMGEINDGTPCIWSPNQWCTWVRPGGASTGPDGIVDILDVLTIIDQILSRGGMTQRQANQFRRQLNQRTRGGNSKRSRRHIRRGRQPSRRVRGIKAPMSGRVRGNRIGKRENIGRSRDGKGRNTKRK